MTPITRRAWFRRTLGALVASRLPLPAPPLQFAPRYYSVSVPEYKEEFALAELNRVTMRNIMPGVVDALFQTEPVLAYLRRRG